MKHFVFLIMIGLVTVAVDIFAGGESPNYQEGLLPQSGDNPDLTGTAQQVGAPRRLPLKRSTSSPDLRASAQQVGVSRRLPLERTASLSDLKRSAQQLGSGESPRLTRSTSIPDLRESVQPLGAGEPSSASSSSSAPISSSVPISSSSTSSDEMPSDKELPPASPDEKRFDLAKRVGLGVSNLAKRVGSGASKLGRYGLKTGLPALRRGGVYIRAGVKKTLEPLKDSLYCEEKEKLQKADRDEWIKNAQQERLSLEKNESVRSGYENLLEKVSAVFRALEDQNSRKVLNLLLEIDRYMDSLLREDPVIIFGIIGILAKKHAEDEKIAHSKETQKWSFANLFTQTEVSQFTNKDALLFYLIYHFIKNTMPIDITAILPKEVYGDLFSIIE